MHKICPSIYHTICSISRSQTEAVHIWTPAHASDEEHSSCWSCPAMILICILFTSVFFTYQIQLRRLPDNSHSSTMHFSWHLQPCAITKKALTFLEWHLGPEWDVLYQHHAVQMGTNIYSSFMETKENRVGVRGWKCQIIEHKHSVISFLL